MHVIEILFVVVLVFVAFAQFAVIPTASEDWSRTKLQILSSDMVRTLDAKGVDWFNETALENEFNSTLSRNIIYSVALKNVIKPKIMIGCMCSDADFSRVQAILSPGGFVINGVNTTFEAVQVKDIDNLFSLDFDVALIYGYQDLSAYNYPLGNFLGYGKGVVEIFDPAAIDDVQRSVFGLNSGAQTSDATGIAFSPSSLDAGRETNKIYDYFSHIPMFYDSFENLAQWAGDGGISPGTGNPAPSMKVSGNGCYAQDRFAFTSPFSSFEYGEVDLDVYLSAGSSLFVSFGKSSGYDYLAMLSSNATSGYDSFYQRSPLQPIGSGTSHLTWALNWNHVKIIVSPDGLELYSNGEKVASAQATGLLPSGISLYNKCGDVYVDNVRATYGRKEFANFLSNENTVQINGDQNKILLIQKGTGLPACIINYNIEGVGQGRTAWVSAAPSAGDDYRMLVKSLVSWAAGDEYRVVKAGMKNPVSSYIYKSLGNDMMQNAKITVELGYLY